jgi:hypothetical protein
MRNTQYKTWILAKNLKNVENETQNCMTWNTTKNNEKTQKKRNAHYRNWNIARKLKKKKNAKNTW